MTDDAWTAHDVTDGRLFCYATSLWLLGMAALLVLLELAVAVGATVPRWLALLVGSSGGLFVIGAYYEQFITGLTRAVLWVHPTAALDEGDRA